MIVRIARAKVGHRQAPCKAKGPFKRALALVITDDDDLLEERQSAGASRPIAAQANLRSKLRPQAGRNQSRSSSGTLKQNAPIIVGAFCFGQSRTRYRISISPSFDLGDAGEGSEGGGDADADLAGGEGSEGNGALDQGVAADGGERDPLGALPALDGEGGDAVETEGHAVGGLDRIRIVVLQRIDDDAIDGFAAVEADRHGVGEGIAGAVVPAAAV